MTLVAVHAVPDEDPPFHRLERALGGRIRLACPALPDVERSGDRHEPSVERLARAVASQVHAQGLQRVVLLGHSVGGVVVTRFSGSLHANSISQTVCRPRTSSISAGP